MNGDSPAGDHRGNGIESSEDAVRALHALATLERPGAPSLTREHTRAAFVRGAPLSRRSRPRHTIPHLLTHRRALLPIATVVCTACVILVYGSAPVYHWLAADVVGAADVHAGGRSITAGSSVPAGVISVGEESELELQLGDQLRVCMLPGTQIMLPPGPGRWFAKDCTCHLDEGAVYGAILVPSLDFPLRLVTPEGRALIRDATFGAHRTDDYSCFCLLSGTMEVWPRAGGGPIHVPVATKVLVYKDDRPYEFLPISADEHSNLLRVRDRGLLQIDP